MRDPAARLALRPALIGAALMVLVGCEAGTPTAAGIAVGPSASLATGLTAGVVGVGTSMLTLPATGKLPTDHALTWATGRDCSILHYEKTGDYCPPFPQEIDRSKLVCTKTLGGTECHERGDRYATRDRPLASPPPPPPAQ